jgi:hypothetical protein
MDPRDSLGRCMDASKGMLFYSSWYLVLVEFNPCELWTCEVMQSHAHIVRPILCTLFIFLVIVLFSHSLNFSFRKYFTTLAYRIKQENCSTAP